MHENLDHLELYAEEMPEQLNFTAAAATVASFFCGASIACAGSCGSSFSSTSTLSTAG
ncbi:thiocillin family RiPP [Anoxybacteroides amylolyticum]|uniref:Thiocillin family RiPP n=1 Tax=Anoxybacteroides amylolyticum TaxID=294699 RepID=A0A160F687_9BACL|nr:thiocillin family RiPP [Anoxybacillus amylolyticus]ANB62098.1 hypothetical protein GFC30_2990 [Anoxybacillus amylolyticus]